MIPELKKDCQRLKRPCSQTLQEVVKSLTGGLEDVLRKEKAGRYRSASTSVQIVQVLLHVEVFRSGESILRSMVTHFALLMGRTSLSGSDRSSKS